MNLYNDYKIILTPNGYKAGKLYALKGDDLNVVRATSATRVNASGLIELVGANVPRLDYTNGTCPTILVEPQRTNLSTYSQDFNNVDWGKQNATITTNNIDSPDGNNTADKVSFASGGFMFRNFIVAENQSYTFSIFVKKGGSSVLKISEAWYVGTSVIFNLNNGTITSGTGKIENYGNSWYRCSMTFTLSLGQVISAWTINDNGNNQNFYIWGAQLEAGLYATSYIPTTSASVTRNADVITDNTITGIATLTTTFEDNTTQVLTNPTSYTMSQGRIKQVIGI